MADMRSGARTAWRWISNAATIYTLLAVGGFALISAVLGLLTTLTWPWYALALGVVGLVVAALAVRYPDGFWTVPGTPTLEIVHAEWTALGAGEDVTSAVRINVLDGRLDMLAENDSFGGRDPYFGQLKTLTINYRHNGRQKVREFAEHDQVILP